MKKQWRKFPKKAKPVTAIRKISTMFKNLKDWKPTLAAVIVAGSLTVAEWVKTGFPENWIWAFALVVFGALSGSHPAPKAIPVK